MLRTILFLSATLVLAVVGSLLSPFELRTEQLDAFWLVTPVFIGFTLSAFLVGEVTSNYSQVDKLWSIVPAIYAGLFAYCSDWNPRVVLVACLILLWSIRLSHNFARRGGYTWPPWKGEEDYRWAVLRENDLFRGHPWRFRAFNFFFICGYQMSLVYLFTLPVLVAWTDRPLGAWDLLLALITVGLVVIEYVADQQQYDYQTEKYRQIAEFGEAQGPHGLGFVYTGLWRHSRHPNYAAEQAIWIVIYGFSVVATATALNPTVIGAVLLLILFVGSADFSEGISAKKYPRYQNYIESTPRFWPTPWGQRFEPDVFQDAAQTETAAP